MKLIVQPDAGVAPVLTAIKGAKKSIDVLIFRLDRDAVTQALEAAVARGVHVRALTAFTNKGGEKQLRELEMRLLQGGVTVSRTADDLIRYHGKMMIVDERVLHVYGFNFTGLDMNKSRSFGVITLNGPLVREAMKLFAADFDREPFTPSCDRLIVSPENARERLAAFIRGARKQLLIYDVKISHPLMLKLLGERAAAGVEVKVIGNVSRSCQTDLKVASYPGKRLHVRAIIRDQRSVFIGSQSLRRLELEKRREIGVIVDDDSVVRQIQTVFERDWRETDVGKKETKRADQEEKAEQEPKKESKASRTMAEA